jgi:hypothetical protein
MDARIKTAANIIVKAGVRYWEDARVNGVEDTDGTLIPGRVGDCWLAVIELASGKVKDWPEGVTADIHYKVCDAGEYWLTDEGGEKLAYREGYVPSAFLCHGGDGWGDYIILQIGPDGQIANYRRPKIDGDGWEEMAP